jgi:hypothetical protein
MVWELTELQRRFSGDQNAEAVCFLSREHPSAHSDVTDELSKAAEGLPGVGWFCPDVQGYAYMVLHSKQDSIFGIALGMNDLVLKLPEDQIAAARQDGGEPRPDIGNSWICFNPFASPTNMAGTRAKLRQWCRVAFYHSASDS